jgi:methyl-accepting chemotaxis protein
LTIDKRIILGFAVVIAALATVAVLSFVSIANVEDVVYGNALDGELAQKEVDHLNWAQEVNTLLNDDDVHTLTVETDHERCGLGQWLYGDARREAEAHVPGLADVLARMEDPHRQLHESAVKIAENYVVVDAAMGDVLREAKTGHLAWAHRVKDLLVDPSLQSADAELDPARGDLGQWLHSERVAELRREDAAFDRQCAQLQERHEENYASAARVVALIDRGQRDAAAAHYMQETKPAAYQVLAALDGLIAWDAGKQAQLADAQRIKARETAPRLREVQGLLEEARATVSRAVMSDEQMLATARSTERNITVVGVLGVVAGLLLAFLITRGIVQALRRLVDGLNSGADQTASAASQVSSASQSLARGASEQAASLEETSASVEETTTSIRRTAANAEQAREMAVQVRQDAESGTAAMRRMNEAIDEIKTGSDETARIIKTIDEIAFQTNLLALNAAVEAARAGEAGKGFAVVAEEVRNLAQRASEAARNTSTMIEASVERADNGVAITQEVADMLAKITEGNRRMNELVDDIAGASDEQARSVAQVNEAVSQLDQLSQDNAANAEESASASEELTAQAEELRLMVGDLQSLIGGHGSASPRTMMSPAPRQYTAPQQTASTTRPRPSPRPDHAASRATVEQPIPLEDDELIEL